MTDELGTNFSGTYLYIKKIHEDAKVPVRSTTNAAGYDLFSLESGTILPRSKSIIKTGISIRLPNYPHTNNHHVYGRIASRSGLSAKHDLEVGAGVIDADYSDEICVIIYNHSDIQYCYKKNERIAQLILELYVAPDVRVISELPEINSNRTGGFGSTGY